MRMSALFGAKKLRNLLCIRRTKGEGVDSVRRFCGQGGQFFAILCGRRLWMILLALQTCKSKLCLVFGKETIWPRKLPSGTLISIKNTFFLWGSLNPDYIYADHIVNLLISGQFNVKVKRTSRF